MPSYGSLHSPSLRKMNGQMDTTSRRRTAGMTGMAMGNIIGDPFALATISIATVREPILNPGLDSSNSQLLTIYSL